MEQVKNSHPEEDPISVLPRVGPKVASTLEKLNIFQVKDLLFHFPYRFQDKTRITPIKSLVDREFALVVGRITSVEENFRRSRTRQSYRPSRSLTVKIRDDGGSMKMVLFHFSNQQKYYLERASWIQCFGEVRLMGRGLQMTHPEYSVYEYSPTIQKADRLSPVYGLTEGIGQGMMRNIVLSALEYCKNLTVPNLLPKAVIRANGLSDMKLAFEDIHTPKIDDHQEGQDFSSLPAMRRLIFEELVSFQVARRQQKKIRQAADAPSMNPEGDLSKRLRDSLKFTPTKSQRTVIREIISDLRSSSPMLRLVQGDVGSGKTLVAAAAAAWVVDSGHQVGIMAPTELLADQHLKSFYDWFSPLGIDVQVLTGRLTQKVRKQVERGMKTGQAKIVIGTHALFQEGVEFKDLGLVIVDEQHRFGVGQRFALREKGVVDKQVPHQLVMTATPIPRTLAMGFYADLDVSSITELPPGRIPIKTEIFASDHRMNAIQRVDAVCASGQQAYWVCPLIDKSEVLDVESAVAAEKFVRQSLPGRRIALIHGRIKSDKRDKIMTKFRKGEIDVLVATTVIEVGVDVPNASLMVIESSERLGLAQLHQLRGRVGRGASQALCTLLYKQPLSDMSRSRLQVMRETTDGFKIAEKDLDLRGAGELLGTRQTGAQIFRIAEISRDRGLLSDVIKAADLILEQHPDLIDPLIRRWTIREGQYSAV